MSRIFCILVLVLLSTTIQAQTKLFERKKTGKLDDFEAISLGDSILLSYHEVLDGRKLKKTFWIADGVEKPDFINVSPFAAEKSKEGAYLYFLEEKKKGITLKAIVTMRNSPTKSFSEKTSEVNGIILGYFVSENLHLFVVDPKGINLALIEINEGSVVSEKAFILPFNILSDLSSGNADVITLNSRINSFKGFSSVKMFYHPDAVYITVDQNAGPTEGRKERNTILIKLNTLTKEVTSTSLSAGNHKQFGSFVVEDKLFRIIPTTKMFISEIYDLQTCKLIATDSLTPDVDFKCYFRYGRKNVMGRNAAFSQLVREANETTAAIYVSKVDEKYIIQWGTYYNRNDDMLAPQLSNPVALIASIAGTILLQQREKPGVHRYFNYEYDPSAGFKRRSLSTEILREKIDHYELDNVTRVTFKTYIDYREGVAGIYYNSKDGKLSIIAFE